MIEEIKSIKGKFGQIKIFQVSNNKLVAKPSGYISTRMIKEDFETIKNYPGSAIDYFVDLRGFVLPNPVNFYYLIQIKQLPNIKSYQIITNKPFLKLVFKILQPILKFDAILETVEFEII